MSTGSLCRQDPIGKALRWLEGRLLRRTRGLLVSSPAFLRKSFRAVLSRPVPGRSSWRIDSAAGAEYGPRPVPEMPAKADRPLRLGWVGVLLRCQRSLRPALRAGRPVSRDAGSPPSWCAGAARKFPSSSRKSRKHPNMIYHGRYKSPEDLSELYSGHLDMVWAGDFMEAGFNSVWLLPNRIYEGGYYCVPAIAPAGTQDGRMGQPAGRAASACRRAAWSRLLARALVAGLIDNPQRHSWRAPARSLSLSGTGLRPAGGHAVWPRGRFGACWKASDAS